MNTNFLNLIPKILHIFKYMGIFFIIFFIPFTFLKNRYSTFAMSNPILSQTKNIINFKDENAKTSYALGVSLGNYIEHSLIEQKKIGVFLDNDKLILGIQDKISGVLKLSEKEINKKLQILESQIKNSEVLMLKKYTNENYIKGETYINQFIKDNNAQRTNTGLVFLIKDIGHGAYPTDNDIVSVNYMGFLPDGNEFDNSYIKGQPISLALKDVIPGWKEGIKHIKKGGRIKLLIPPYLAYGEDGVPGIPGNSTLIFDIELLDIKSA